jgi:hypothetical protein
MPKFTVSCDLLVPVLLEIEAASEEAAVDALYDWRKADLLKLANTEEDAVAIVDESIDVDVAP